MRRLREPETADDTANRSPPTANRQPLTAHRSPLTANHSSWPHAGGLGKIHERGFTARRPDAMITRPEQLERLEAEYARDAFAGMSYAEALDRYAALWALARAVRPSFARGDWREDLEPDLAVARAVNGLPPAA